ncbi:MAG: NifU family protein [Proteobacteria bacterium]|nr:NifU family protein [Pseudomonadota bacterium]
MFIQTESTPNPNTLKFIPGVEVMPGGTADFANEEASHASPLAEALFNISDVARVFYGSDFITVTKKEDADWPLIKPVILTTIMEHFVAGLPLMKADKDAKFSAHNTINENDSDLVKQIKELIDTRVRPAVAEDGGDIVYRGFENGVVRLELHGACSGCPSSTATLKQGIENMLKHYVPEVIAVEAVPEGGEFSEGGHDHGHVHSDSCNH